MSESESIGRSFSNSNSRRSKSKNYSKIKPGSLPWEEETMTYNRDNGSLFLKLQRENFELRKRLKDFNAHLNTIIEKSTQKPVKKKAVNENPIENLEIVQKKLRKEYLRLENRQSQLSDPSYEAQLKKEISKNQKILADYEEKVKKDGKMQKIRGKELNSVLETGEKADVHKHYSELNTQLHIITGKYEKKLELNEKTAQSHKDINEKIKEFEKEYEKLKKFDVQTEVVPEKLSKNDELAKLKKTIESVNGHYKSKIKTNTLRIKKLEEELENSKNNETKVCEEIEKSNEKYKALQLTLNDLQMKIASQNRKNYTEGNYSDDLMFITEKV